MKRDENNYRVFDDRDVAWINSLNCLRNCNMSIQEMREYIDLCMKGEATIPEEKRKALLVEMQELQKAVDYIDWKQGFYDDVLSGKTKYFSNLIATEE